MEDFNIILAFWDKEFSSRSNNTNNLKNNMNESVEWPLLWFLHNIRAPDLSEWIHEERSAQWWSQASRRVCCVSQHLVMKLLDWVLATSNRSESLDVRMSSLPLTGKDRAEEGYSVRFSVENVHHLICQTSDARVQSYKVNLTLK